MNIIVIFPNRLGDTLTSLPFIQGVKINFPESKIYALISEELIELINLVPVINGSYPKIKSPFSSLVGNIQTARNIRKDRKYDLCFCLSDSFSTALIAYFARIKIRIGYKTDGRGLLLTHSYSFTGIKDHNVNYLFHLLERYLQKRIEKSPYTIKLKHKKEKILPKGKNLVFNINSLGKSRILPIWKAKEIIIGIQQNYNFNIILVGAPNEKKTIDQLMNQLPDTDNIHSYAGKTSLLELTYLLFEGDIIISTDTGTAHLANSLGTKLIVFFGAGDYRKTRPHNPKNLIVLNKHLPCSPCMKGNCKFDEPICLTQIGNKEIFSALDSLISVK